MFVFFFSSRRRHTRWPRDWSSDVCSSDLRSQLPDGELAAKRIRTLVPSDPAQVMAAALLRKIGRASCRERVEVSVEAGSLKKHRVGTSQSSMERHSSNV